MKLIVIGGPTASGKTDLALEIAQQFNGELINADSRQIYKYLDIGTNKEINELIPNFKFQILNSESFNFPAHSINNVPIHLLSFLNPDERFDVFTYKELVYKLIEDITSRGKQPILVGGTGLYIDAVIKNYQDPNQKLRIKNYELRNNEDQSTSSLENLSILELQNKLKAYDSELLVNLNNSDLNNPRRLIRLIEKLESGTEINAEQSQPPFEYIFLYPKYDRIELMEKINVRVLKMFDEGLINETRIVLDSGFSKDSVALQGIGYRQVVEYLDDLIDLEECKKKVQTAHRRYAKRQITWFEGKGRNYDLKRVEDIEECRFILKDFLV